MITRTSAARPALAVVAAVTLLTVGCGAVSVTRAAPPLQINAEDAVGSLSSPVPPVLQATVTQEGQPVEGLEVRFAGLNADGDNLGGLGFATTDSKGVATAPAQQPSGTTLEGPCSRRRCTRPPRTQGAVQPQAAGWRRSTSRRDGAGRLRRGFG